MSIRLEGGDQYIQLVNSMANKLPNTAREVVRHYTAATQAQAVRLEPVKTGYLRRNTQIEIQDYRTNINGIVTANAYNKNYNYGARQEFDTKLKHPNGGQALFMTTAFNAQQSGFLRDIKDAFK